MPKHRTNSLGCKNNVYLCSVLKRFFSTTTSFTNMYPTLSDLIYDLTGVYIANPIKTFGFFMALAFLLGAFILYRLFLEMEREGKLKSIKEKVLTGTPPNIVEVLGNALLGFVVGYKGGAMIGNWKEFSDNTQAFLTSADGSLIGGLAMAALLGGLHYYERKKQQLPTPLEVEQTVYPHERVGDIIMIAAVTGILGAKIFTWIEDIPGFLRDPIGALLSFSGLTFYGGLIVAAFCVIYYGHRKKIPAGHLADAAAPVLMIGYGIGRLGCHFSGDGDWGIVNTLSKPFAALPDWLWAYTYPNNVNNDGIPIPGCVGQYCHVLPQGVYPTSVYEFLMASVIFIILLLLRKKMPVGGMLFGLYLLLNGIERFSIEFVRHNDLYNVLGAKLSQAQIIAIGLMITGTLLLLLLPRFKKEQ